MTHYLVCATQRSGSTLLCNVLAQTGLAGTPKEHLLLWLRERNRSGEAFWLETLQRTIDLGSTPNGVFGCKVMANYFPTAMDLLRAVPRAANLDAWQIARLAFSSPRVLFVRRREVLRQAISTYIAKLTGVYHMAGREGNNDSFLGGALKDHRPDYNRVVSFDYDGIRKQVEAIGQGERYWRETFASHRVTAHEIVYEDLVADLGTTVGGALEFLGIEYDAAGIPPEPRTSRLSNEVNERFHDSFLSEARDRGDPPPPGSA